MKLFERHDTTETLDRLPEMPVEEAALKSHALANGPAYAHPRRIFFLDALPLASTNKVDKRYLEAEAKRLVVGLGASGPES